MKETSLTYGVFLTRGQPFHEGHLMVIKNALADNDRILVIIGSSDKYGNERNPFDEQLREKQFKQLLTYLGDDAERVKYIKLQDWSSDKDIPYESTDGRSGLGFDKVNSEWGLYFYYNVVNVIGRKDFTMYYNDDPAIIGNWFPPAISDRITVKTVDRTEYSSSRVRHAMLDGDKVYLKAAMPFADNELVEELTKVLKQI